MTDPRVTSATDTRPPLTDQERDLVRLEVDGPIAVITNNRPEKHNAMSDEMDRRLWEVLAEVHELPQLRAIVWRGEGKSFSSGRDTGQIGVRVEDISDLEFIERGHRPTQTHGRSERGRFWKHVALRQQLGRCQKLAYRHQLAAVDHPAERALTAGAAQ